MTSITFTIEREEMGGYVAFWDDPRGGGITTQGETLVDLQANILDATRCHFSTEDLPKQVLLRFVEDVVLEPA